MTLVLLRDLPEELLAAELPEKLDTPSAGRFAQATRACQRIILTKLIVAKLVHDFINTVVEALPPAPAQPICRLTELGRVFVDTFLNVFNAAASTLQRRMVIEAILEAAPPEVGHMPARAVMSRLRKLTRNMNAA